MGSLQPRNRSRVYNPFYPPGAFFSPPHLTKKNLLKNKNKFSLDLMFPSELNIPIMITVNASRRHFRVIKSSGEFNSFSSTKNIVFTHIIHSHIPEAV